MIEHVQAEMMQFLKDQAPFAHYYIFGLFVLAGLNIPVSEDFLFITAAILSVQFVPEHTWLLFLTCYIGAYLSDLICYGLGRTLGFKILNMQPFNRLISKKRLTQMFHYYERYGAYTLFFGRFIPFGVRNAIFLTAGISKMPVYRFAIIDLIACTITSSILFTVGRSFAHNYEYLMQQIAQFNLVLFAVAAVVVGVILYRRWQPSSTSGGAS